METLKAPKYRWVILSVYMFIGALTQLYWLNFAAIDTYVEQYLQISAMKVGALALVFPLTFLLLSIPAGIIVDKKGFKFGVGIGVIFTGVFSALRMFDTNSYTLLLISQLGISIGQPFVLNAVTKLALTWFPKNEEATAVGLGSLSLFLGMVMGLGLTPTLTEALGFKTMLLIYAILGIASIPVFFLLVKSKPKLPLRETTEEETSYWNGIKKISKIKDFIILGFIALIGIGVFNGLLTWLEKILNEMHNINMVSAGNISSMLVFSGMIGCIVIPMVSDKIMKRKPFLAIASLVGLFTSIILIFAKNFLFNSINAIIMGFFVVATLPIMLTISSEITGVRFAGISTAYLQLLGNGAAVVIVPIIEILHKSTGKYTLPLLFISTLFGVVFILTLFINESFRKN